MGPEAPFQLPSPQCAALATGMCMYTYVHMHVYTHIHVCIAAWLWEDVNVSSH